MTFDFGLIKFKSFSLSFRYNNWFVFKDGVLSDSFSAPEGYSSQRLINKLKQIGLSEKESCLAFYTILNYIKARRIMIKLLNLNPNKSYHAFILNQCMLLRYMVEMGYPKAIFYLQDLFENNGKVSCNDTREISAFIDVPANSSCVNCKWGKHYAKKRIIF